MELVRINHSWAIGHNPVADGIALFVDRGIPCECHKQLVTRHMTNTPTFEQLIIAVDSLKETLNSLIDAFVNLVKVMWFTDRAESIAQIFYQHLLSLVEDYCVVYFDL